MTTYLLDTHAFVWAATAPERLGGASRTRIEDPSTTLLVSAATAWELATKVGLGRFPEAEPLVDQYAWVVERLGAIDHPISAADALRSGRLRWAHRDPFDRMLVAQAMSAGATLISRDRAFDDIASLEVLW